MKKWVSRPAIVLFAAFFTSAGAGDNSVQMTPSFSGYPFNEDPTAAEARAMGVAVKVHEIKKTSGVQCEYQVRNNSKASIFIFGVGMRFGMLSNLNEMQFSSEPSGTGPTGWFESYTGFKGKSAIQWQGKTMENQIQPGQSALFTVAVPTADSLSCDKLDWAVHLLPVAPKFTAARARLSITLAHLHQVSSHGLEGDVIMDNEGPENAMVALGIKFGGNAYARGLLLVARDHDGNLFKLDVDTPGIAGSAEPMVIALVAHRKYDLHAKWWTGQQLKPGKYNFYIEFKGEPAYFDLAPAAYPVPYWLDKAKSNEVELILLN